MDPAGDKVGAGECTLCGIGALGGIGVARIWARMLGGFDIVSSCKQQWR